MKYMSIIFFIFSTMAAKADVVCEVDEFRFNDEPETIERLPKSSSYSFMKVYEANPCQRYLGVTFRYGHKITRKNSGVALYKFKLDNFSAVSIIYEFKLADGIFVRKYLSYAEE